jgi:predicted RNase H-like HicB family nuclease
MLTENITQTNTDVSAIAANKILNYTIILESIDDEKYQATIWNLPDCQAIGLTKEEAIAQVQIKLQNRLKQAELLNFTYEIEKIEHPALKFAKKLKDNPLFSELQALIEAEKQQEYMMIAAEFND